MTAGRDAFLGLLVLALCGCGAPKSPDGVSPAAGGSGASSPATPKVPERPEPYEPGATVADVVAPYVRPERSSRLGVPLPRGKARERWSVPLEAKVDPAFIVVAGKRVLVQGRAVADAEHPGFVSTTFVLLDTNGRKVATGQLGGTHVRLVPDEGKLYALGGSGMPTAWQLTDGSSGPDKLTADDPRGPPGSLGVRASTHGGMRVFIQKSSVEIETIATGVRRPIVESPVESLDASIDDDGNVHVLVRQDRDLALWTTPLAGGSVGRVRIGPLRRDRADVPPILGKSVRVIVLDDRLIAVAPDGKTLWERKGALTGGATMTADDRLLVASDAKILAIDPSGRATELASAPKEIFLTPPILTSAGLLLVASGSALHAYAFE